MAQAQAQVSQLQENLSHIWRENHKEYIMHIFRDQQSEEEWILGLTKIQDEASLHNSGLIF